MNAEKLIEFTNVNLFDGKHSEILPRVNVVIEENSGKIKLIAKEHCQLAYKRVDLHGKYMIPGLINAHTHIMMDPEKNKLEYLSETEVTVNALNNLKKILRSGVTYIRDCGCAFNTDIKLASLHVDGPQIIASGRPMTMTGGHADFVEGIDGSVKWGHIVDSENEMRRCVRRQFKIGSKNIKVMATGGVMSATDEVDDIELSSGELKVAVSEAHSKHMTVASHAQGNRGIQISLDAGVDSIEHGIYIDEKQAEFMKRNQIYLVPTLNAPVSIAKYGVGKLPNYMLRKNDSVKEDFFKNVAMAIKRGVKVVVGTDAGTPYNTFETGTWQEIELLYSLGATPAQALFGATSYAAELLKISADYGTLEPGKKADFLVIDNNPLEDLTAIEQIDKLIFQNGKQVRI
ncbi:MAG: amidohydrolase family protein [Liquorilactobacillus nagelii]|uniref:metal-dependent hydrolase family protein n=1 Tax=Liquorilactobacillus nagelii TaxID=82688 RepID=UPI0039EAFBF9